LVHTILIVGHDCNIADRVSRCWVEFR